MLPDAARIQEQDVDRRNRRADRAGDPKFEPIYTHEDALQVIEQIETVDLGRSFTPFAGIDVCFWNAGHILGSASIELSAGGVRSMFSGDLGPENKSFHADPSGPSGFDHVVCESTYGDRERPVVTIAERRHLLQAEVTAALKRGGNLVIPVFALERTQELLLDLASLINSGELGNVYVYIDSPLATQATGVFWRHRAELEDLGTGEVFHHPAFHYVESTLESMHLNTVSGAVILAASGMCEAGRIRHHLLHNLSRRDSTVLFVGFQAQGSLGRTIVDGAKRVRVSGQDLAVRCHIRRIESYSAHADRKELLHWIRARTPISGSLFLDHGEPAAIESLRRELTGELGSVIAPQIGESYELTARGSAKRLTTGRTDLRSAIHRDWQNEYADFSVNLKRSLQRIESDAKRTQALALMREVIDQFAEHREKHRGEPFHHAHD
jgi:metallo-beta-lactamase family protein